MGHALLWIVSLAAALLCTATVTAWAAGRQRRWLRVLIGLIPAGLFLAAGTAAAAATGTLKYSYGLHQSWFEYTVAWTFCLLVGLAWVLRSSFRAVGEPPEPAGRSWPVGKLAVAAGTALLLLLATFWNMDAAAKTQLAALRAEAGAISLAVSSPRPADRNNAAYLYQEAFDAMVSPDKLPPEWKARIAPWQDARQPIDRNDANLKAYLDHHAGAIALVRRGTARPECYFDRGLVRFDTLVPELDYLRQAANLLSLQARWEAAEGNLSAALADTAAIFRLARHAAAEPFIMSVLVGVAIERIGLNTLDQLLATGTPKAEELAPLKTVEPFFYRAQVVRSLQAEQAMGLAVYGSLAEGDSQVLNIFYAIVADGESQGWTPLAFLGPIWRLYYLAEDVESYRQVGQHALGQLSRPYPHAVQWSRAADEQTRTIATGMISRSLLLTFAKTGVSAARGDACRRLVQLGTALAEYRSAEGKFPAKVEELVPRYLPAVPLDPFSGEPLRMVPHGRGVAVYSIGPDSKDHSSNPVNFGPTPTGAIVLRIGTDQPVARPAE